MRNPGTDFHRRQADAEAGAAISRSNKQRRLNAAEWRRRGKFMQAELEDPDTSFDRRTHIRATLNAEIIAKVLHPSQAPWSQDGVRECAPQNHGSSSPPGKETQ